MENIVPIRENKESKAIKEFARFAHQYDTYNVIQSEVAKRLVSKLPIKKYDCIVDIGCGNGEVYKNIKKSKIGYLKYIALDSSLEMLSLHPTSPNIKKMIVNFNHEKIFEDLDVQEKTLFLSSSALQWSKNLDITFSQLSQQVTKSYFSIFTANTFRTLHKTAGIKSPIYSEKVLKEMIQKYYHADFELVEYKLEFNTIREMFKYIKKSGVSGGEKRLGYKEMKVLMDLYPLDYLEFEVLFVEATSLAKSK